ncbi:MAG: hypothetical protein OXG37_05790 [Actinomycetia bacterium]|nr:hypothetical protein [Actinomycetes bacterium]
MWADGAGNGVCTLFRRGGTRFAESVRDGLGRTVRMAYFDEDGQLTRIINAEFTAEPGSGSTVQTLAASLGCSTDASDDEPHRVVGTVEWHWNRNSFPAGMRTSSVFTALKNVHNTWENNNNCAVSPTRAALTSTTRA